MSHPPFVDYRRRLKRPAHALRHDPTPAQRKPLGDYIADFYCASELLIIEVDGDSHFTPAGQSYDRQRSIALEAKGVRVLRFTNLEVMQQFEAVCQRIKDALKI